MAGFGSMPLGSGPFGLGTPLPAAPPPVGPAGCRFINPVTKDYEVDSDTGQLKQMPGNRQRVLLALMTLQGSSSVLPQFGARFPKKMGNTFEARCQQEARRALRQLTEVEGVIRIDGITVTRGLSGRALIVVSWTDLESETQEITRVG